MVFRACAFALAATAFAFTPLHADITPEAAAVVARYVEAIGGRAAYDAVTTVHGTGKIEAFGFTGTIETWTARPNRRASAMALGPMAVKQGYDGHAAWRTDPSGKVLVLDGKDLERAVASAWYDANRWLEPDQGGGRVALAAPDSATKEHDVLEVTAPAGERRLLWVNRKTGLIDKIVVEDDRREVVNEIAEYMSAGGLKFPRVVVTKVENMPMNDAKITFDSLRVNIALAADVFAAPGGTDDAVRYLRQSGRAAVRFRYPGNHVWVRASVNGGPYADFIFDTGASITVLDSAYAASIGLETQGRLQGQGAGAVGTASLAKLAALRVSDGDDGIEMRDVPIAVLSVNEALEPFFWRPCAGIIGFNVISQFVVEIDYDGRVLHLIDPKTFAYAGKGEAIPMKLAGTVPTVEMTVDGEHTGEFRVDVGSSATVDLHRPFAEQTGIWKSVKKYVTVVSGGFGGSFDSRLTRMKSLSVGGFTWRDPIVSLSGAETGALASEDYAGNIGNRLLDRFRVTFDYERRQVWLEPGLRYGKKDDITRTGLQLARYGEKVVVAQVLEGSPAMKAGIRRADEVRMLDGKPILEYDRETLERLFEESPNGTKMSFEIVRGGTPKPVKLTLKTFL